MNTAYAELNLEVGPEKTADVAARLGIKADVGSNLANVLGDATVTPLELTNAYATIAAQGMKATPHIVASVTDSAATSSTRRRGPTSGRRSSTPR